MRQRIATLRRLLGHALQDAHRRLRLPEAHEQRAECDRRRPALGGTTKRRLQHARRARRLSVALEELRGTSPLPGPLPRARRRARVASRLEHARRPRIATPA